MKKVYIAIGHGRGRDGAWDPGCIYGRYTEADLMLHIGEAAIKYLKKQKGIKVYSDAFVDNDMNIATIDSANSKDVDLYVSLHCDFSGASSGIMALVYEGSKKARELAEDILNTVSREMDLKVKTVKEVTDYYECRDVNAPSTIFEAGGIKADLKKLKDYDKYGKAIAKGICKNLGIKFKDKDEEDENRITGIKVYLNFETKCDLILRKGKSFDSDILDTVPKGTKFEGIIYTEGWVKMTYKGKTGFLKVQK